MLLNKSINIEDGVETEGQSSVNGSISIGAGERESVNERNTSEGKMLFQSWQR